MESSVINRRGLQRLAAAMLRLAVRDIGQGYRQVREDAIRWVNDANDDHLSFTVCCCVLNREPTQLRRQMLGDFHGVDLPDSARSKQSKHARSQPRHTLSPAA